MRKLEELDYRPGPLRPASSLKRGWKAVKPHYGVWLIMGLLVLILSVILVPLFGPLVLGLLFCAECNLRGCRIRVMDLIDAPQRYGRMVPSLILGWLFLGCLFFANRGAGELLALIGTSPARIPGPPMLMTKTMLLFYPMFLCLFTSFGLTWLFWAMLMVLDRQASVPDAIQLSVVVLFDRFLGLMGLSLITGVLLIAGSMFFCVGVIFVLPLVVGMQVVAWRLVFPR